MKLYYMIKLVLLIIIISIILEHLSLFNNKQDIQNNISNNKKYKKHKKHKNNNIIIENDKIYNQPRILTFDKPEPWNKIIFDENNKYPYTFFITLDIPNFNDYHNWKQIIPTLNFIPHTKELTISTINENVALAIINLIILTFSKKLTLDDIISKDLINISISKSQEHNDINNSFKNQIIQYLYESFENITDNNIDNNIDNNDINNNFISAYDNSDYSYL